MRISWHRSRHALQMLTPCDPTARKDTWRCGFPQNEQRRPRSSWGASGLVRKRTTHASQMYTLGPAMRRCTWCCGVPQKEHHRCGLLRFIKDLQRFRAHLLYAYIKTCEDLNTNPFAFLEHPQQEMFGAKVIMMQMARFQDG